MKIKYFVNLIELGKHNKKRNWKIIKLEIRKPKEKSDFLNKVLRNDQS